MKRLSTKPRRKREKKKERDVDKMPWRSKRRLIHILPRISATTSSASYTIPSSISPRRSASSPVRLMNSKRISWRSSARGETERERREKWRSLQPGRKTDKILYLTKINYN